MRAAVIGDELDGPADTDVAWRLQAGDSDAFAYAYDVHADAVYGVSKRVTMSAALAEEITQEVFLDLWERPERFDPSRSGLRTYLCMIAHRRAVDRVRSEAAHTARERRRMAVPIALAATDEAALVVIDSEAVRRRLCDLPADQQACLELAYFGGLTFREVARRLGIPEGTAKTRIRLGLQRLGASLAGTRPRRGSEQR